MKQNTYVASVFCIAGLLLGGTILLWAGSAFSKQASPAVENASSVISKKMDDFHDAADKGDKTRYLNHFAQDAVFMGTDDWERWPFEEFSKYVKLRFRDGKGWSYKPIKRYINFSAQGDLAWVDEIVESQKWGRFRGTAVLAKLGHEWKLKHYSLTVLVPNEAWQAVSEVAKNAFEERTVEAGVEPPAGE
jgi:ketosteroid isomerase-like protein